KHGFSAVTDTRFERALPEGALAVIDFTDASTPRLAVRGADGATLLELPLKDANLRQNGSFLDAHDELAGGAALDDVVNGIRNAEELSYQEIVSTVWRKGDDGPALIDDFE